MRLNGVFGDRDNDRAGFLGKRNREIREQFGCRQIDQRLIGACGSVDLAGAHLDITDDGGRFEPLRTGHTDRTDHRAFFGRCRSRSGCPRQGRIQGWRRSRNRCRRCLCQRHTGHSGKHRAAHQGGRPAHLRAWCWKHTGLETHHSSLSSTLRVARTAWLIPAHGPFCVEHAARDAPLPDARAPIKQTCPVLGLDCLPYPRLTAEIRQPGIPDNDP